MGKLTTGVDTIYAVILPIEFLPGCKSQTPASICFTDKELAEISLAHIQQTHPKAILRPFMGFESSPEVDAWIEQSRRHTEFYSRKFLATGGCHV